MIDFPPDAYHGRCSVCGEAQLFIRAARAIRETYHCRLCRASLREREQAQALLDCLTGLAAPSLSALPSLPAAKALQVYEPGVSGALRPYLSRLPGYHQSAYLPIADRRRASGPAHQDLQKLTYADASFDVVITSDILEHVRRPQQALAEIARVLRPGGVHVCTVPLQLPLPARTVARVDVSGEEDRHLLPPHYHGNGQGGQSLVYNDFGADIVDLARAAGFEASLKPSSAPSPIASAALTLVCRRPAA